MNYIEDRDYSAVVGYAESFTSEESGVLRELREECERNYEDKSMLSGFVQGRILSMFSRMIRPKVVLEIGTYLGYSALCFAEGLAQGGKVITLDIQEDTNKVAKSFVERSKYKDSIEFHLGFATEIIPTLSEVFDLVFIDADKPNYSNYYDLVLHNLATGGPPGPKPPIRGRGPLPGGCGSIAALARADVPTMVEKAGVPRIVAVRVKDALDPTRDAGGAA